MYTEIMVPVDLGHADKMDRVVAVAADLAKHYGANMTLVGVTSSAPSSVARNPGEFAEKLKAFATTMSERHGVGIAARAETSHDPTSDLDEVLDAACHSLGANLVVMATHVPTMADLVFGSNTGKLASHLSRSILMVR
jgi:nucleotide-binding universal stress UspA family protein